MNAADNKVRDPKMDMLKVDVDVVSGLPMQPAKGVHKVPSFQQQAGNVKRTGLPGRPAMHVKAVIPSGFPFLV